MLNLEREGYNPDVLSCLANLSNDEVFTPPEVANRMLDLLPQELFRDPTATFLDPACKSGVFLREIARRLIVGLQPKIPDLQERLDHIFHKQVFGIAITELTSLLSRRSLYCSKFPNSKYSVSRFATAEGNVRFRRTRHEWKDGRCAFCGASQREYDRDAALESHAYEFIHVPDPREIFKMKFDVIIGNPPYQLNDGGQAASAMPIYQKFVEQAKKLNPQFLVMIIPARWYVGGRGLDEFRNTMLNDRHIRVLHDFPSAADCFPGVEIKGGVCFFRWDKDSMGDCEIHSHISGQDIVSLRPLLEPGMNTFIRTPIEIGILAKVKSFAEQPVSTQMRSGRYFGYHTQVEWNGERGTLQTADGKGTYPISKKRSATEDIKVYIAHGECWISRKNVKHIQDASQYKLLVPNVGNPGSMILGLMKISEPGSCSSNTYNLYIAGSKTNAENVLSYFKTKFVRYLVSAKTTTHHTPPKAFDLVPLQDFSKPWTDAELYEKYGLEPDEIAFIESMIRPME